MGFLSGVDSIVAKTGGEMMKKKQQNGGTLGSHSNLSPSLSLA